MDILYHVNRQEDEANTSKINIDELYVADNYHFFIVPSLPLGNIIDSQIFCCPII